MFDIRNIQENVIYNAVKEVSNEEAARQIVYGVNETAKTEKDADWVKSTMHRLEENFNQDQVKSIRCKCQCGYGIDEKIALVKRLKEGASSFEELTAPQEAKEAGLFCQDGELYLQFHFCPCPMLAKVDRLETSAWCQCTTGYSKVLFEKAFDCEAEVTLLSSIKMGAERCLMKITLSNPKW